MAGEILILWTIRLSMFHYALFLACLITEQKRFIQRWLWTVAYLLFLLHFLAAFHFYHEWSHRHAFADTATQTGKTIGVEFGSGIYFSYLFLVLWAVDVVWWWRRGDAFRLRDSRLSIFIQAYIFFIAFNGTIVFEDGAIRWAAILACLVMLGLILRRSLQLRLQNPAGKES